MTGGYQRRQADINRRIRAVKAVIAYSKASPELLDMAVDECEQIQTDNLALIADLERVQAEWTTVAS